MYDTHIIVFQFSQPRTSASGWGDLEQSTALVRAENSFSLLRDCFEVQCRRTMVTSKGLLVLIFEEIEDTSFEWKQR